MVDNQGLGPNLLYKFHIPTKRQSGIKEAIARIVKKCVLHRKQLNTIKPLRWFNSIYKMASLIPD